jgi:hypothetical protein
MTDDKHFPSQAQLALRLCLEIRALQSFRQLRVKRTETILSTSQVITSILQRLQALSTERSTQENQYQASISSLSNFDALRASLLAPDALNERISQDMPPVVARPVRSIRRQTCSGLTIEAGSHGAVSA